MTHHTTRATRFLVRKDNLSATRLDKAPPRVLAAGEVRLAVDSFALTSNNITYAAFGDAMNYWQFFPTGEDGWGNIPVWGFATVRESLCDGIAVGEKFYGYYPMASEAVLAPVRVDSSGFADGAAHRRELHAVYNQYMRCSRDPFYSAATEDLQALLRPLFITSFLIDDFLADNDFFGAATGAMLLSSASSKTAYGTAFQLAQRPGIEVIGLTSPANVAFCESLGCYSRVLTYAQLDQIAADRACIYVDFAGNAPLRHAIHSRFAKLKYSCSIGGTHVTQLGGSKDLPGPRATLFFAPAQIKKRSADWGRDGLGQRLVQAWQTFSARVAQGPTPWLLTQQHEGSDAVAAIYQQVLAGSGDPRTGHILKL
ncbi:DUF2855 family protein [Polaromonas sp. SM01]|uniref:DUF2855 family protein n=1 Tax=Polaromonas sp. SM01 TaxID=3085630 RepID=UPI002982226C|nr:DUF2855 family protein [Polaromonas sp. SM01]MDW5442448.1 DUF2855 family protein [Polaromonas sp. SM01]